MDHVAIMKKSWNLIPKILSGEKTIESRWYMTKRAPWNKASIGDTIYFKNTGEPIIAKATISNIKQYEPKTIQNIENILSQYAKDICLINTNPKKWGRVPHYVILLTLTHPKKLPSPFNIDKKGFGMGAAWLCVKNIESIRI